MGVVVNCINITNSACLQPVSKGQVNAISSSFGVNDCRSLITLEGKVAGD